MEEYVESFLVAEAPTNVSVARIHLTRKVVMLKSPVQWANVMMIFFFIFFHIIFRSNKYAIEDKGLVIPILEVLQQNQFSTPISKEMEYSIVIL